MSDLIERLRAWAESNGAPIWTEAADELARQADELKMEEEAYEILARDNESMNERIAELERKVEYQEATIHTLCVEKGIDGAEIVKLEAVAEAAKKCAHGCRRCNSIDDRYANLRKAIATTDKEVNDE